MAFHAILDLLNQIILLIDTKEIYRNLFWLYTWYSDMNDHFY